MNKKLKDWIFNKYITKWFKDYIPIQRHLTISNNTFAYPTLININQFMKDSSLSNCNFKGGLINNTFNGFELDSYEQLEKIFKSKGFIPTKKDKYVFINKSNKKGE